jgi:hypothetical protein
MMKTMILGLLLTLGGVGGVENSADNVALIQSVAIAAVGLALMYVGSMSLKENE